MMIKNATLNEYIKSDGFLTALFGLCKLETIGGGIANPRSRFTVQGSRVKVQLPQKRVLYVSRHG